MSGEQLARHNRRRRAILIQDKALYPKMPDRSVTFFGWKGLFSGATDGICAPANEIDDFDKRIRDPAVLGDKK